MLAWVNSICILVFVIGLVGANVGIPKPKALPSIEQPIPAIVEPLQPPPQAAIQEEPKESQENQTETPQVVVVTPDSPSINFSVPTIGNILVPNSIAKAPPLKPLAPVAPLKQVPANLSNTGTGGSRPEPPYPKLALQLRQQGSVVLALTVDDSGHIVDIRVKQSSGFPLLDRSSLEFVKKHWTVVPGEGTRLFEAMFTYQLR